MNIAKVPVLRIVVWSIAVVFFVFLFGRDVQLDRTLFVSADTVGNRATSYVSEFGPPPRVELAGGGVRLTGEPVYVNVRLPRWFTRTTLMLTIDNPSDLVLRVGPRTHPDLWQFDVKTVSRVTNDEERETDDGDVSARRVHPDVERVDEQTVRVTFELARSWQVERNVYRFIFSAPGVSAENPITIRDLSFVSVREALCFRSWCL
jgi:hypothetical protein